MSIFSLVYLYLQLLPYIWPYLGIFLLMQSDHYAWRYCILKIWRATECRWAANVRVFTSSGSTDGGGRGGGGDVKIINY